MTTLKSTSTYDIQTKPFNDWGYNLLIQMGAVEFEYRLPHKKEYGSINYFIKAVMRCPLFINSEALMFDSLIDHIKNGN